MAVLTGIGVLVIIALIIIGAKTVADFIRRKGSAVEDKGATDVRSKETES